MVWHDRRYLFYVFNQYVSPFKLCNTSISIWIIACCNDTSIWWLLKGSFDDSLNSDLLNSQTLIHFPFFELVISFGNKSVNWMSKEISVRIYFWNKSEWFGYISNFVFIFVQCIYVDWSKGLDNIRFKSHLSTKRHIFPLFSRRSTEMQPNQYPIEICTIHKHTVATGYAIWINRNQVENERFK